MKKTIGFILGTLFLMLTIFIMTTKTVQSSEYDSIRETEAYYQVLEKEYLAEVRGYLNEEGLVNCGVMLTRVVEEDGNRIYTVTIHHVRLDKFTEEEKADLIKKLRVIAFEGENCSFTYSVVGNA